MKISDEKLPPNPTISIHPSVLVEKPGLAVMIACVIASWAETEARLESIHLSVIQDEAKLSAFQAEKGWDRRVKMMSDDVGTAAGSYEAAKVRSILSVVARAAEKRNELAHGFWGSCAEAPDRLVLFKPDTWTQASRSALEAEAAGSAHMALDHDSFFSTARLVGKDHLEQAWTECEEGRGLINTFWIDLQPDVVKVPQSSEPPTAMDNVEVAARYANAARSIRQFEKQAKRQAQIDASAVEGDPSSSS